MGQGHGEKLTRKMELAIACLLSEPTVEEAAKKAGVSYRSLKGWLSLPGFKAAFRSARTQLLERVVARLLNSTGEAVDALQRNLTCKKPGVEVRAALALIQQSMKGVEVLDLETEVQELKAIVEKLLSEKMEQ